MIITEYCHFTVLKQICEVLGADLTSVVAYENLKSCTALASQRSLDHIDPSRRRSG